jgi:ABC-2 type transport system ATP-binding protein
MSETAGKATMTPTNGAAAIETNDLTKCFGAHVAVDRLSFSVPRGSIFGFLGPNGAGKTTTIGMLLGLIPPDGGSARVLGFDTRSQLDQVLQRTGALVERPAFYPFLSGRRNLLHFARQLGIDDPKRVD